MKYLLLIYGNEAAMGSATKSEIDQMHAAYGAYTEALQKAGVIVGGERLRPSSAATTVRVADGKTKVLAQYGLTRAAELAEVPTMLELAKSDADRQAMTMLFARTEYGRPYFLPPDVPAERVAALRRAFDATMKDAAFVAEAAKLQFDVDPLTGEAVQALVGQLAATPREVVTRVRAALEVP